MMGPISPGMMVEFCYYCSTLEDFTYCMYMYGAMAGSRICLVKESRSHFDSEMPDFW